MREVIPKATAFGALLNPTAQTFPLYESGNGRRRAGCASSNPQSGNTGEIELAFETAAKERMGAVIVSSDPVFLTQRDQIVALATRTAMPNIHAFREYALAGGLMSYGPVLTDAYRLTGIYAGRILNGEKPGDLPVQQAVKVELLVNLKTAKARSA